MIRVRRALEVDIPDFVAMEADEDTVEFITPYSLETHASVFRRDDIVYLSIVDETQLLGFLILCLDADGVSVEFRRIVVSEKGRGTGQGAIAEMECFCRATLGRSRIWLDVFEFNERGRHIYEKLGYTRFGAKKHDGETLILYEKVL